MFFLNEKGTPHLPCGGIERTARTLPCVASMEKDFDVRILDVSPYPMEFEKKGGRLKRDPSFVFVS